MRGYDSVQNLQMHLQNNGHTVQVDLQGVPISITRGGLKDVYLATQFHFHWGKVDTSGSEHDIDGTHYPMEMHIVHYNTKYKNFDEALVKDDGLAVLGFFFEVGKYNIPFDHIIDHFSEISHKDDHTEIDAFDLRRILPDNLDRYFRYYGSLTTPPCYESLIWTIFYETIEISENQLETFRHMIHVNYANQTSRYIFDDYRPPQSLNSRKIYCSKPVPTKKTTQQDQHSTSGSAALILMAALTSLTLLTDLLHLICR
ncbi:hypothetical protein CHS0354_024625 [Potamilus streckersoni]|nr:hypothetical protein CHS0354_024625 [Potamilus streckersoni]